MQFNLSPHALTLPQSDVRHMHVVMQPSRSTGVITADEPRGRQRGVDVEPEREMERERGEGEGRGRGETRSEGMRDGQ